MQLNYDQVLHSHATRNSWLNLNMFTFMQRRVLSSYNDDNEDDAKSGIANNMSRTSETVFHLCNFMSLRRKQPLPVLQFGLIN